MRLADGKHDAEGRVELCQDGVWGAVSANYNYWTVEDAMVTCRQLGFPSECELQLCRKVRKICPCYKPTPLIDAKLLHPIY